MTTCQICGRAIKASKGLIAHHGYQRPRYWHAQTASCFGARYRPYEIACDALPPAIKAIEQQIQNYERALVLHIEAPPERMTYPARGQISGKPLGKVERPEGFTPDAPADYRPNSYVTLYRRLRTNLEQAIKYGTEDLKQLRERLAGWRAAA